MTVPGDHPRTLDQLRRAFAQRSCRGTRHRRLDGTWSQDTQPVRGRRGRALAQLRWPSDDTSVLGNVA
ncbi:hypothetical protein ACWD0J_15495, partial [Streptomyces sp. NPDC003011]